jgi:hypothetical protein
MAAAPRKRSRYALFTDSTLGDVTEPTASPVSKSRPQNQPRKHPRKARQYALQPDPSTEVETRSPQFPVSQSIDTIQPTPYSRDPNFLWADEEFEDLKRGVAQYGRKWARICDDPNFHFINRSPAGLRIKWDVLLAQQAELRRQQHQIISTQEQQNQAHLQENSIIARDIQSPVSALSRQTTVLALPEQQAIIATPPQQPISTISSLNYVTIDQDRILSPIEKRNQLQSDLTIENQTQPPSSSVSECSNTVQPTLSNLNTSSRWTEEEESELIRVVQERGSNWTQLEADPYFQATRRTLTALKIKYTRIQRNRPNTAAVQHLSTINQTQPIQDYPQQEFIKALDQMKAVPTPARQLPVPNLPS